MLLAGARQRGAGEDRPERRPLGFSRFMTAHLKEQHQLYRALMRGPRRSDHPRQVPAVPLRDRPRRTRPSRIGDKASAPEIAVQFVVGAYMSVVTWWLDRGAKEPPEEIDRAFRELAMGSLRTLRDR